MAYEIVQEVVIPKRSRLIRLQPMGVGTHSTESLYSWALRLAEAHCLTLIDILRLAVEEATEDLPPVTGRLDVSDVHNALLTGTGGQVSTLVAGLQKLTGQVGLECLTLLPHAEFILPQGRGKRFRKWCAFCLDEDAAKGVPYHRLLWDVGLCNVCPRHNYKLSHICENCGCGSGKRVDGRNQCFSLIAPGFCFRCGAWLGLRKRCHVEKATSEETALARLIGDWLAAAPYAHLWGIDNVRGVVRFVAERYFDGQWTRFAKFIGINKSTVHGWVHGEHQPNLKNMVNLARVMNIGLSDLCCGRTDAIKSIDATPRYRHATFTNNIRTTDWHWINVELRRCLAASTPISLSEFCRSHNVNIRLMAVREPKLVKQVVDRYAKFCAKKRAEKLLAAEEVAVSIVKRDVNIGSKKLREKLKQLGLQLPWEQHEQLCSRLKKERGK